MNSREAYAALFVILVLIIFCLLLLRQPSLPEVSSMVAEPAGAALWKDRTFEVVLQGFLILAGVMSILLLVSARGKEDSV